MLWGCSSVLSPPFSSFILWLFYPCSNEESFLFCIKFLPTQTLRARFEVEDVRIQRSLFLEKLYRIKFSFQRDWSCNFWTSERWDKGHKPKQSLQCRNFGLVQSLFFNSLFFGLRNNKTELYALHMFYRPSSQLFENGYEHPELNCIASLQHMMNHYSVSLPGSACSVT